jgi:tRNA pseudouridine55 synthase
MDGYINYYKESGETSNKALGRLKRELKLPKAGFLGTLDPCAEGVLPIGVGFGTRLFPYFENTPKTYLAEIIFGSETDTQDSTGKTTKTGSAETLSHEALSGALEHFTGEIEQIPPMYSARRIEGKRLYEIARSGKEVLREPKKVTIHKAELIDFSIDRAVFRAVVSTGTYIRTYCEDVGRHIGIPAHMGSLTRETSHTFEIEKAIKTEVLENQKGSPEKWLLPLDYPLGHLPRHDLTGAEEQFIIGGQPVNWYGEPLGDIRLYGSEKNFLGIGSIDPMIRKISPAKIFRKATASRR